MKRRKHNKRPDRAGATAVEFALVAPLVFLTLFASIEFGRGLMTTQSLEEAARSGCRVAILLGMTDADVEAEVDRICAIAGITTYTVDIQPVNIGAADRWDPVTVSVSANYSDVSWLPLPGFFSGKSYTATATLPKEYSTGN